MKKVVHLLASTVFSTIITGYALQLQAADKAFEQAQVPEFVSLPEQAIAGQSNFVKINKGLLRSGKLQLDLLDGVTFSATRDQLAEYSGDKQAWIGHVSGNPGNRVIITSSGDAMAGVFHFDGRLFHLGYVGNGVHVINEVHSHDPYPELDPQPIQDLSGTTDPASSGAPSAESDTGAVVDVMIVYTAAYKAQHGNTTSGAEAEIMLAVAETNLAYQKSGIATTLRLAHAQQISYSESGNMLTDLERVTYQNNGYMDNVHALRDTYGADLVSLFVNSPGSCGIAWRMDTLSSGFAPYAFSVVHSSCATGYYSFGHEISHNMGSTHDHDNASTAMHNYSFGYQDPGQSFRTVMAYNCPAGCTRVQHFSNPDVNYNGMETGVAEWADNARSINNAINVVANWRDSVSTSVPLAPSSVIVAAVSHDRVDISWVDESDNEDSFNLERSTDGINFSQIASLTANSTAFQDQGLSPESSYIYRVRSVNSVGASAYSVSTQVTTEAAPPSVDNFVSAEINSSGSVSSNYSSTYSADGINQTITEVSSGGKPKNRYGRLEHTWTINVPGGNIQTLFTDLAVDTTNESFTFAYSTDNSNWVTMFVVDANSSFIQQYLLPSSVYGNVYIRVTDNDHTPGITSYSVEVDELFIRSETQQGAVPVAATNLTALATSASSIELNWQDNAGSDSYGYEVLCSEDNGISWEQIATTGQMQNQFVDTGLAAQTYYLYQVRAFNGSGKSELSVSAGDTTFVGADITLSGTANKVKGVQHAVLSWQGSSSNIDIYRNGNQVVTNENNDGHYDDNISTKGSASYVYQICETGTDICSDTINIIF